MAGINLLFKKSGNSRNLTVYSDFMRDILYHENIWSGSGFELSIHKHEGYPYTTFSSLEYDVFVEGKVYNLCEQDLRIQLQLLLAQLRKQQIDKKAITDILFNLDGDYIIVLHDKINKKTHLLNDIYGRLPIYYCEHGEHFMFSRNVDVIINTLQLNEIDSYGVAEFLTFGYSVTERTMIKDVNYFLPGSLFSFDLENKQQGIENIYTYNFENLLTVTKRDYKSKLYESVELFKEAILQRTTQSSVIGLSGGLDSRVLAVGLKQCCPEARAVSRLSFNNREKKDVVLAEQVSKVLNIPFQIIKSEEPNKSYLESIITLKGGLNSIENDYNLIYEKKLQSIYGKNFTYFTGDAGDRIKPHIRINKAKSLDDFVNKLISVNTRIELIEVSKLLNIDVAQFINNIKKYIKSFPEQSFAYKDLHFRIYSRGFRYVLEGEDRKRNFFWTVMPFYGHQFFLSVMSFPDNFKKDYKMFLDFMNCLDPKLSEIVNKNWNLRPNDWRVMFYLRKDIIPRKTKRQIQNILSVTKNEATRIDNETVIKYLKENRLYNNEAYKIFLKTFKPNRSNELFIRTPIFLYNYLNN